MIKVVIVFMLLAMVVSLGVGLYHLLKTPDERDKGDKVVKALTWRIAISAALFGFIILAVQMGWIKPRILLILKNLMNNSNKELIAKNLNHIINSRINQREVYIYLLDFC